MADVPKAPGRDSSSLIEGSAPGDVELSDQLSTLLKEGERGEELFRMFVESVQEYAIFMLDPRGHVASWNTGAQRIKGYRASEIIGSHFSRFYPESEVRAGKCEHELDVAIAKGRFEDEGWRVRKDGSLFWANVVISAMRDDRGRLVGFSKVTRDLTDRKRAEQDQLQRLAAEELFRLLVDSVRDNALFMLDLTGKVTTWNIGAQRIKGYAAIEIIGRHFSAFYPASDVMAGKCEHELEVATREERFEDEGWRVRKDGSHFWAAVVVSAVHDKHGHLIGFSRITRDLTERMKAEQDAAARLSAEHANRAKDEFLAMLGHELRNPLAPIVTALQLIKLRGEGSSKEHEVIDRQLQHMMHLVDDLLDVSRITSGKLEIKNERLDLREIIAKAVETSSPLLEQRQHRVDLELTSHEIAVDGDLARLTQVFTNLVVNAAKYTGRGGHIRVTARTVASNVEIAVADNGIGISADLLPRVFDLFIQGYQTPERAGGGLGLGLTLVNRLVALHGGSVRVESPGAAKGSTFTVTLPVATQPKVIPLASANLANRAAVPRRILIVDDNEDARCLLAELLQSLGHEVNTAIDGVEALTVVQRFSPEVAILDIGLPVMDGYELASRLRAELEATPRFIALTGYAQDSDRERTSEAGFDVHLVKPVDLSKLLRSLSAGA
ncbi:MAG: PAS domain S-box protein [Deltaproteobacteria bacterium]|nr:PAS domain S-box protein [Deltaproteobacteria bacterium]